MPVTLFQRAIASVLSACVVSAILTWCCIRISLRFALAAQPREDRWHSKITPNTGGVAVCVASALVGLAIGVKPYGAFATAAIFMAILGFVDDRLRLSANVKFLGQALSALGVVATGLVFHATGFAEFDMPLTFFWIVGVTNAFNLIDNMDGLSAGVVIIVSGFRFITFMLSQDLAGAVLTSVLAGAYLGFLFFNYKPAKIFMGDAGSMFGGFLIATLSIAGTAPKSGASLDAILYPILTCWYPIFDTALVSIMRKRTGRKIWIGGRDHSSHRLVARGVTERLTVGLLWGIAVIGAVCGCLVFTNSPTALPAALFLFLATALFGFYLSGAPVYQRSDRLRTEHDSVAVQAHTT